MIEEDVKHVLNEEKDQEYHDYIERWFAIVIKPDHSFISHYFLTSYHLQHLVFHALMHYNVSILNLSMNVFLYLLLTWLHWKYSYTWRRLFFLQVG